MRFSLNWLGILIVLIAIVSVPAFADTSKPSVTVSDVKVTPGALMPGDAGEITFTITNPARAMSGTTTSVSDTYNYGVGSSMGNAIGHSQTVSTSSSNAPDGGVNLKGVTLVPEGPVHVTSTQYGDLGRLGLGDSIKLTYQISVDSNAADATYVLTLKVRTDDGDVYINYPVCVEVDSSAVKMVINDAPKSLSTTKKSVTLDLVNLRPDGVESVSVVPVGDEFTFKPMQEYIVGSIGAGEMYTVQFDVTANNASFTGNPSFKVVYKNGDNWHETQPMIIYSDHGTTTAAVPSNGGDSLLIVSGIIVLAIIVLGGIFVYMRGKRSQ